MVLPSLPASLPPLIFLPHKRENLVLPVPLLGAEALQVRACHFLEGGGVIVPTEPLAKKGDARAWTWGLPLPVASQSAPPSPLPSLPCHVPALGISIKPSLGLCLECFLNAVSGYLLWLLERQGQERLALCPGEALLTAPGNKIFLLPRLGPSLRDSVKPALLPSIPRIRISFSVISHKPTGNGKSACERKYPLGPGSSRSDHMVR